MLYERSEIKKHFASLGIKAGDSIFVHGNAAISAQFRFPKGTDPTIEFFHELRTFLNDGTIIVPSFTYSATKGEIFDVDNTPSEIGVFSEKFRMLKSSRRSKHPIFSVCASGPYADRFTSSRLDDCFGDGTVFDSLFINNVKILTLGCPFERVTFLHYVEQSLNVSYRYFKNFKAGILHAGKLTHVDVQYYVRKMEINGALDLKQLEQRALERSLLRRVKFGRFLARAISSRDLFDISRELILENEFSVIKEGF